MTTAAELDALTQLLDLRRALDALTICNRQHLARIARLNALTVAQAAEIAQLTGALARARAEGAELRAGVTDAGALGF